MTTEQLFWQLGVHIGTVGCTRAIRAIELVLEDEDRLTRVVEYVYSPVADAEGCSWKVVERNLRTVIHRAWTQNRLLLEQIAGYCLTKPPCVSEFLDIVYNYMARQETMV